MATKLPMVYTYVSEEEKRAFEVLAKIEKRSLSQLLRFVIAETVKGRGLLAEEVNDAGEIVQTVLVGQDKGGDLD
jgi:hypothetical protein